MAAMSRNLQRPTLVLNRHWQPVNVATVARALLMLWNQTVRVVDPADYQLYDWHDWADLEPDAGEPAIVAVRGRIRLPEVVVLNRFDRVPSADVSFSRRNVFKRDRYTCQYCGVQPGTHELSIDHVVPRGQGGISSWTNCVLACIECNKVKANRTPQQAGMRLRRKPVQPAWRPFYSEHATRIESWAKFVSEAYWTVDLNEMSR